MPHCSAPYEGVVMQNAQDLSKILDHALSHLASRIRLSIQTLVHPKHQHVRGFARIPSSFRKKPAMQIIESSSVAGVIKRSFDRPGRNWIKHIVFPDFQRPYCWSLNDIQKILDDIDELRYSPDEERYREEDEYYLGAICIMPLRDSDSPEHAHDMALLDGQQRLTSLMILARVLYERAMRSKTDVLRSYGANIAWIMGRNLVWKRAFLYQEPATLQHIRQIYFALDREYRQLEADAALDDAQNAGH